MTTEGHRAATSVVVFTRDLRVADNPALSTAVATSAAVVPLFVLDDDLVDRTQNATRLRFLLEALADLDASLRQRGGALVVRRGPWLETVVETARACGAEVIHIADDVSGYASARLARLKAAAQTGRMTVLTHAGVTVVPAGAVRPASGSAYQVFTPYYRRWLDQPRRPSSSAPRRITLPAGIDCPPVPDLGELTSAAPARPGLAGGESAGLRRLRGWIADDLADYEDAHDDLAADRTSRLSPYLHLGCLSASAVATELATLTGGAAVARQLAWRDFFHQVLAARPDAAWSDFRSRGDEWADDLDAFQAWQAGMTGYPVVDAGMRQLLDEGFMHNRARMITASFLTKDLYLDWRLGAAHFLRHLVDGDIACNQLNWQWVAGTGTDTNPARVFNPVVQSRRFDPDGSYIRRYVPELAGLAADRIHEPALADRRVTGYPSPLVDHRDAVAAYRARATAGRLRRRG